MARFGSILLAGVLVFSCVQATVAASSHMPFVLLVLDSRAVKWGEPRLGTGAVVTYAVLQNERHFKNVRNCPGMQSLDPILSSARIKASVFEAELAYAFSAWSEIADISFMATSPERAQILIGAQITPVGRAFTNVAYQTGAQTLGVTTISQSLICLNPKTPWKVGFGGDLDTYDLRYTLTHEIGHAIGLDHPTDRGELMYVDYQEKFRVPQAGDIAGARELYGPPMGNIASNTAPHAPTSVTRLPGSSDANLGLSAPGGYW